MALVSFKEGTKQAIIGTAYSEGSFYYSTDTHEIAFDMGGTRQWHEHSDYLPLDSIGAAFEDTELKIAIDRDATVSTDFSSYHYEIKVNENTESLIITSK